MGESRIEMPQTPQVTEKAEDEGGKGTQSISPSICQTPEVTEKTEDEGGKTIHSMLKRGKAIFSSMLNGGKGIFSMQKSIVNRPGSSQPPEKANYQVAIPAQSNNVPCMFPLGLFHGDGSEKIERKLLDFDFRDNFGELVKNMIGDTPKIRKWYVGAERRLSESNTELGRMMDRYSEEELGRMMARSGLLLLEFLRSLADLGRLRCGSIEFFQCKEWQLSVQEAVIKIDNRIPIFVLKKILECELDADKDLEWEWDTDKDTDLHSILKHAWLKLSPIKYDLHAIAGVPLKDDSHLLEFLYENIIGSSDFKHPYRLRKDKRRVSRITLPPAVQLKGKGVKFAPNKGLLNEIRFDRRDRTLYLPTIEMDGKTDAVLRNLVLFEASKQGNESQPLRSYVNLMQRLIDTADDVQALRDGGIIHSHLGTNNDVAKVWNGMPKQVPNNNIKYTPIDNAIYDVKSFYTSKCRTICTEIYRRYFSKPWSAMSFFAACILLGLAGFQTYLAWEQVRLQRESKPKT